MSYWEDLLGFGRDSTPRDSVSENDSLDAFRYAMRPKNPMGKSDLLDELRRIQAQRRQRADQQQYEYQRAQAEMGEQMQNAFGMGQMNQLAASQSGAATQQQQASALQAAQHASRAALQAAQHAALQAIGIGLAEQGAAPPRKVEPAKPAKKTVDLVEPGQRKIETDE